MRNLNLDDDILKSRAIIENRLKSIGRTVANDYGFRPKKTSR